MNTTDAHRAEHDHQAGSHGPIAEIAEALADRSASEPTSSLPIIATPPNTSGGHRRRPMSSVSGSIANKPLVVMLTIAFWTLPGLNLVARIIWYRIRAKIDRVLRHREVANAHPVQHSNTLPHEIVQMIIGLLVHDVRTLKACSLTCHSWYIAALPHIQRTLVLRGRNRGLNALSDRHALGLSPFTKEIGIEQAIPDSHWFLPQFLSHQDSRPFFTFTNVQNLRVQRLDIAAFFPEFIQYFGHLSSTLRSLTLYAPRCTALQLSHFISSFPNLDDVIIRYFAPVGNVPDEMLTPLSTPKLGGKLVLVSSDAVETWEHLAISCGLRFRYIRVWGVKKCVPVLLDACATTLETLRIELLSDNGTRTHAHLTTNLG